MKNTFKFVFSLALFLSLSFANLHATSLTSATSDLSLADHRGGNALLDSDGPGNAFLYGKGVGNGLFLAGKGGGNGLTVRHGTGNGRLTGHGSGN